MITRLVFVSLPLLLAGNTLAMDMSEVVLCASMDVYECVDGSGCNEVLAEDVGAPTFFRVDLENEQLIVTKADEPNEVEHYEAIAGRVILQGIDASRQDAGQGLGWTVAIEEESGRMVATATIVQGAVIIFGACTEQTSSRVIQHAIESPCSDPGVLCFTLTPLADFAAPAGVASGAGSPA